MAGTSQASLGAASVATFRLRIPRRPCRRAAGSTRLAPAGPGLTRVEVQWLVHEDAIERRDYQLERLTPFWDITNGQHWALCQGNQIGVRDSAYIPGPYSA